MDRKTAVKAMRDAFEMYRALCAEVDWLEDEFGDREMDDDESEAFSVAVAERRHALKWVAQSASRAGGSYGDALAFSTLGVERLGMYVEEVAEGAWA